MTEARFYIVLEGSELQCELCPHECRIKVNHSGICKVRRNIDGRLYSMVYGKPVAIHFDPIEKKPLYHFHPGTSILSIGTLGCNMNCFFCQNSEISQAEPSEFHKNGFTPTEIIHLAGSRSDNIGIAYTYNEPVIFFEYMVDIARMAQETGLKNVMVTNGYIKQEPLKVLLEHIDAFNVDLKSFRDEFYRNFTHSLLKPVLETIKSIIRSGKHIEITNLIIPGLNDDKETFREMINWIKNECGKQTVFHISRYFPRYKSNLPPTPLGTLNALYEIAAKELQYVYSGNYENETGKDTFCPDCHSRLIVRHGYSTNIIGIDRQGSCSNCGKAIIRNI